MAKRKFGELELEIQQILKGGKKMTVKQVLAVLGDENKYTTIMTVLNRLHTKKVLLREKIGLQYVYWLNEESTIYEQVKKRLFGVKSVEMVSYFVNDVSDEELDEMEKIIQKAIAERKKS